VSAKGNWGRSILIVLVERSGEPEGWLVIGFVDAGESVGADIEALIPLQDHRQDFSPGFGGHNLAVHHESAAARAVDATEVIEGKGAGPFALVDEIELHLLVARGEWFGTHLTLPAVQRGDSQHLGTPEKAKYEQG
jgi:hypothetical protein